MNKPVNVNNGALALISLLQLMQVDDCSNNKDYSFWENFIVKQNYFFSSAEKNTDNKTLL